MTIGRLTLGIALAIVSSCATLVPRPSEPTTALPTAGTSGATSPSPPGRITTSDLVTIRQSAGARMGLFVRSAATGEVTAELPDGVLMPDGRSVLAVEPGAATTSLRVIDRFTRTQIRMTTVRDSWRLVNAYGTPGGVSGNGKWVGLVGSAYNVTDASGKWTSRSTFGLVDTAFETNVRASELNGKYSLEAVSDDGGSLYVWESPPGDQPLAPPRLRVYDVATGAIGVLRGDDVPPLNGLRTEPIHVGPAAFSLFFSRNGPPDLVRLDADRRTARVTRLADRGASGDDLWSMAATRDGRQLFVIDAGARVVHEVDPVTLSIRRSGTLATARPSDPIAAVANAASRWLVPVAEAKTIPRASAVISADGGTLYAIGQGALLAVDTSTLAPRSFEAKGQFADIALSPDGRRLYALNAGGRWMSVFDAVTGAYLAQVDVGGFPQAIVAVDP